MAKLIVPVGLPGSGKSTLAATLSNVVIVSSDAIRGEFFGDEGLQYSDAFAMRRIAKKGIDTAGMTEEELLKLKIQVCNASVFGTVNYRVKEALSKGKDVVYDATNLNRKGRVRILEQFKGLYESAEAYFFDIPKEVALARNAGRERKVPEEVINRMATRMEKPTTAEGFSIVHIVTA